MAYPLWTYLIWIAAAGLLGLAISFVFSDRLQLSRRWFLVPYLGLSSAFLYAFWQWSGLDLGEMLTKNGPGGVFFGILVGALLAQNVVSQPASERATGLQLAFDLLWIGIGYGAVDALLLNIMPVAAIWAGLGIMGAETSWINQVLTGGLGLIASLLVALLYHLGYREFRNAKMGQVLLGNGLITLSYVISGSALAALLSHVLMHITAVLIGPKTTLQLPPHREPVEKAIANRQS